MLEGVVGFHALFPGPVGGQAALNANCRDNHMVIAGRHRVRHTGQGLESLQCFPS